MRKNKFIYTLSALMMACIIAFSGVGGSYIKTHATSVGIPSPGAWNEDASAWENICKYLNLYMSYQGVYVNPNGLLYTAQDFYDFMMSDGVSHDVAHGIFCSCDDSTHTSFSGNEHGGGGFIRDGVIQDDDGNVTYSDEVSDLFHDYICNYLETENGYCVVETLAADEIPQEIINNSTIYTNLVQTIKNFGFCGISLSGVLSPRTVESVSLYSFYSENLISRLSFFSTDVSITDCIKYVGEEARESSVQQMQRSDMTNIVALKSGPLHLSDVSYYVGGSVPFYYYTESTQSNNFSYRAIVSSDGRLVKVWDSLTAFKKFDIRQQPYYVTQNWVNYDASVDNSVTITNAEYTYYNDNSTTIYQTIQNNIDNSGSDLTEADIQKIVDDAVKQIKDEIANSSGSGDSDDGNGSTSDNDTGSGGTGVGDLIEGIGKIFDTILSLIGKLMGVVADFTQSILDLFSGFTTFTDGFSDFLAGAFTFIPAEIWDLIKVGLSLMILLAVISFWRK